MFDTHSFLISIIFCFRTDSHSFLEGASNYEDEFGYLETMLEAAERRYSMVSTDESEDDTGVSGDDKDTQTKHESSSSRPRKKQKIELPKVMKNDIRRYFSRMFMNTINSADFINMQNFFNMFMTKDCTFVSAQLLSPVFQVPDRLVAIGPRLFSHYLLGSFVMYPDMVLVMKNSRIVTSSSWSGTKVEMEVEYHLTKTYHIPLETWVPPAEALADMYNAPTFKAMVDATQPDVEQQTTPDAIDVLASQFLTNTTSSRAVVKKRRNRSKTSTDADAGAADHIPENYIRSLHEGAVLLENPQVLRVQGQFTIYLDENNHIQLVNLSGVEL